MPGRGIATGHQQGDHEDRADWFQIVCMHENIIPGMLREHVQPRSFTAPSALHAAPD
jgi:hypothetical protein